MTHYDEIGRPDPVDSAALSGETLSYVTETEPDGRDDPGRIALREGDRRAALVHCVREHGAALGRYCMAMLGSRSEADDVVRATLLAVCSEPTELTPGESLRARLLAIARRDCARRIEMRRTVGPLRVVKPGERSSDLDDPAAVRATAARTKLGTLRPTEREALVARFVAQLNYAEVAAAWNIDESEARDRVSRALSALSARLEKGAP